MVCKDDTITNIQLGRLLHSGGYVLGVLFECFNEYLRVNSNLFLTSRQCKDTDFVFKLNLFDSSLFQWQIIKSTQNEKPNHRKYSYFSLNHCHSFTRSLINYIQSLRQHIPSNYSSWNVLFPNYHPVNFSLQTSNIQEYITMKNPYGRTGLIGQSLFEKAVCKNVNVL